MTATFTGNIGKDAVLRKVQNGDREDSVVDFWVAENIKRRDGSYRANWHKVTLWRGYAEAMAPLLKKGREVLVTGTLEAKSYQRRLDNGNSETVPYIAVQGSHVQVMGVRKEEVPQDVETTAEEAQSAPVAVEELDMPW